MTKCFFILEIIIKEGLAAYKTQFEIKQKLGTARWGKLFDRTLYKSFLKKNAAND